MANLFEIDKAIKEFAYDIDEETGEILNADALDELQMARDQKLENIGLYIKNIESDAAAVKAEKDNMAARQKALENKADSLRKYLAYALNGEKFSTARVAMSWRKSESVDIAPGAALPAEFARTEVVTKPDKVGLKAALKAGAEYEGITLVTKQNLQIK